MSTEAVGSPAGEEAHEGATAARIDFTELVHAHFAWRRGVEEGRRRVGDPEDEYHRLLASFEREHGKIVSVYWCAEQESAVALTQQRWRLAFHRASDWATRNQPAVAEQLHRCDALAARAVHVLTGVRRRICMHLVIASASHLLSLVDERAKGRSEVGEKDLEDERGHLDEIERYYRNAANGQAQILYFAGMALFAAVLTALAVSGGFVADVPNIDDREFFGTLLAGAVGAVVSVTARINSGVFDLEYDVGRIYPFFVGGLRPAIGAVFGVGFYFAISSGLVDLVPIAPTGTERFYALVVVAFVAGFSERWAKDTLAASAGAGKQQRPPRPDLSGSDAVAAPARPRPAG